MQTHEQKEMEDSLIKGKIEELYHQLKEQLFRYTLSRVGHREVAEDITSTAFVRFIGYISKKNDTMHHYRGLLYTIAKGEITNYYRASGNSASVDIDEIEIIDEDSERPEQAIDLQISLEIVNRAMEQLPEYYKELIRLRHIAQLEYSEIAGILQKKEGAIRMGLHRAVKMAQELVNKSVNQ